MGVLKIIVLSAVIFIALGDEIKQLKLKPTSIIDTRCKRETEIDSHSRDQKVPFARNPTRLLIPVKKSRPLIPAYPLNTLPRQGIVKIRPIKPKLIINENINHTKVIDHDNDTQRDDDPVPDTDSVVTSESVNPAKTTGKEVVDSAENKHLNIHDGITEKVNSEIDKHSKLISNKHIDQEIDNEHTPRKLNKPVAENDVKIEKNEKSKDILDSEKENNLDQSAKGRGTFIPVQKKSENDYLSRFKLVPNIPTVRRKSSLIKERSEILEQEQEKPKNSDLSTIDIFTDLLNDASNNTKKERGISKVNLAIHSNRDKVATKIVSEPKKVPVSKKPTEIYEFNIPADEILTKDNSSVNKTESDFPAVTPKSEPEEIVILNTNYEELYEDASRRIIPKVVAADWRPSIWNNFNTGTPQYGNYYRQNTNENKPYLYKINKQGNEYIVDTYNDANSEQNCIIDKPDQTTNNFDVKDKNLYSNARPWYQCYSRNQGQQRFVNNERYNPTLIWRSWNNNQIFIKPKYGSAANAELYKGVGRYLANASPAYFNKMNPNVNQNFINTSPRRNPFQYYGY